MKDPIKIHSIEVRNEFFDVHIDARGRFIAEYKGKRLYDDTRQGLYEQLVKTTKKAAVKVSIPYSYLTAVGGHGANKYDPVIKDGVATGVHQGTGKLLVKENGVSKQRETWGPTTYRPLTGQEAAERIKLQSEFDALKKKIQGFDAEHGIDVRDLVSQAVDEATS